MSELDYLAARAARDSLASYELFLIYDDDVEKGIGDVGRAIVRGGGRLADTAGRAQASAINQGLSGLSYPTQAAFGAKTVLRSSKKGKALRREVKNMRAMRDAKRVAGTGLTTARAEGSGGAEFGNLKVVPYNNAKAGLVKGPGAAVFTNARINPNKGSLKIEGVEKIPLRGPTDKKRGKHIPTSGAGLREQVALMGRAKDAGLRQAKFYAAQSKGFNGGRTWAQPGVNFASNGERKNLVQNMIDDAPRKQREQVARGLRDVRTPHDMRTQVDGLSSQGLKVKMPSWYGKIDLQ